MMTYFANPTAPLAIRHGGLYEGIEIMFGWLKATKSSVKTKVKGRIFHMDSMGKGHWGDSIKFNTCPSRFCTGTKVEIIGWKSNRPRKGDFLRLRGLSGQVWVGKFTRVKLCRNPADMFFADVSILGHDLDYDN